MNYSRLLIGSNLWVPDREVDQSVKERLTFSSHFDKEHEIEAFRIRKGWCGLPRYFTQACHWHYLSEHSRDRRVTTEPFAFKVKSGYKTGQKEIIDSFVRKIREKVTGVLIQVPTAGGKTFLGIKVAQLLCQRTLVVVPKSDLVEHWITEILKHTNIKQERIGWVNGDKVIWQGRDIVVGLVHSLALNKEGRGFINRFGCVIFDEVDRSVPPETFGPVAGMFPAMYRIGLSAELRRKDGLHKILDLHVGESRIIGTESDKMHAKVVIVRLQNGYEIPSHLKAFVRRSILLKKLSRDKEYNRKVAFAARKLTNTNRTVMILAEHARQLYEIREQLLQQNVSDKMIGYYSDTAVASVTHKKVKGRLVERVKKRKVSEDERAETVKLKYMLATYGMANYGTNIPALGSIVVASPRSSALQYTGRAERKSENKQTPIIFEFVHVNNPDEKRWMKERLKEYRRNGNEVTFLDSF